VNRRNWALGMGVAAGGVAGVALVATALAVSTGGTAVVKVPAPAPTVNAAPLMKANASPLIIPAELGRPAKAKAKP